MHTRGVILSFKVSQASVSLCKSATIQRRALFPPSLSECWVMTPGQEVIYRFCLNLRWLPDARLWFEAYKRQSKDVYLQEAQSAAGIQLDILPGSFISTRSQCLSILPLLFLSNAWVKMKKLQEKPTWVSPYQKVLAWMDKRGKVGAWVKPHSQ